MSRKVLTEILGSMIDSGNFYEERARKILALPFIECADSTDWREFYDAKGQDTLVNGLFLDDLILLDAVYALDDIYMFRVQYIDNTEDPETGVYKASVELFFKNAKMVRNAGGSVHATITINPRLSVREFVSVDTAVMKLGTATVDYKTNESICGLIILALCKLKLFNYYQDSLDRYAIEVSPPAVRKVVVGNTKRGAVRLKRAPEGPRIVYLNELPKESNKTPSAGDSVPVGVQKTHQRKGSWRTLTHERFAKHPKYMIEKAIRVRAYWVGDRETVYQGHTYRILEKPSNDIPEEGL